MKILICDYDNVMESDYTRTIESIQSIICNVEIKVIPYSNSKSFYDELKEADGMITAFIPLDNQFFEQAENLKCVSINAVGYGNVDLEAAKRKNVGICHIEEYCTTEVAEHTMSLICTLNRNIKYYIKRIEIFKEWKYQTIDGRKPLENQKIAIFGFGKIGKKVAKLAKAFNMEVMVVDPYVNSKAAGEFDVRIVTPLEAFETADIISNHMNATKENYHYFGKSTFEKMKNKPLFINVGRGSCVNEEDLVRALDEKIISGAGLDVLEDEKPDLASNPLLDRDNVVLTPHSAFYSEESMAKLQEISGNNLAYYLTGNFDLIRKIAIP